MNTEHKFHIYRIEGLNNPHFMTYKTQNSAWSILVYLRYDKNDHLIVRGSVRKRKGTVCGHIDTAPKHKDNGGDPLQQPMLVDYSVQPPFYVRYAAEQMYELMYAKLRK